MAALNFPSNPSAGDIYAGYIFDGVKWDPDNTPLSQLVNGSYALTLNSSGHTNTPGDLTVSGNLAVSGTTTYSESTNTVYTDNVIEIHAPTGGIGGTWSSDDGKDIGLQMHYYNSGDKNAALVLAQDTGYLEWYKEAIYDTNSFTGTYGSIKLAGIKFSGDNSIQSSAWDGDKTKLTNNGNNLTLNSDGTVTFPNNVINTALQSAQLYSNTSSSTTWVNTTFAPGLPFRTDISASSIGAVISVESGIPQYSTDKTWIFDINGSVTFPDSTVQTSAWTGLQTSVTGNAGTATKLAQARAINGVYFDGSAAITVTADAGTLTGTTLSSGVTSSSLTSVGTLESLTVSGTITIGTTLSSSISSSGTLSVFDTELSGGTLNIGNIAGTVNIGKSANITIGKSTGQFTINNPNIVSGITSGTLNVFNSGTTGTINIGGAAITTNIGSTIVAVGAVGSGNTLKINSTTTGIANLTSDSTTGAINVFTNGQLINIGASSGNTTVNNNLRVTGNINAGANTFTKSAGAGDIAMDNGTSDTPGMLLYYSNNNNWGIDSNNQIHSVLSGQLLRFVTNLNESGGAVRAAIDVSGNMVTGGFVLPGAWRSGQVIKETMLSFSDITKIQQSGTNRFATDAYDRDTFTYSYTPSSSSSYLIINFHLAKYSAYQGTGNDSWISRIKVNPTSAYSVDANGQGNGAEITYSLQDTTNGNRTGTLFPLLGRYTNSDTTAKTIAISVRRGSADDYIDYDWSATSVWMRITEVAR